jgi:pyruvate ferredoxin oxidoreductase delta subunit
MKRPASLHSETLIASFSTRGEVALGRPEKTFSLKTSEWRFQRPLVDEDRCNGCGICFLYCSSGCIDEDQEVAVIDMEYCKGCGVCARMCPRGAIQMEMER